MPDQNNPNDNQNQNPVRDIPAVPQTFPEDTNIPPIPSDMAQDTSFPNPIQTITDAPPQEGNTPSVLPPIIPSSKPKRKFGGKMIATILGIFLLVGAIGVGVVLVSQKELFQQKAGCTSNITCRTDCGLPYRCMTDSCGGPDICCDATAACPGGGTTSGSTMYWFNTQTKVCTATTQTYDTVAACQANLAVYDSAISTGVCYASLTVCQDDNSLATPTPPPCPTTKSFPDVTEASPYYEAVTSLAGAPCCSIAGYADGTFKPNQNITRAEAVTFITAYHVYVLGDWEWTLTPTPSFPDVPTTHFAYVFIETAKTYGFIAGFLDGTFKPNDEWLYGFCGINKPCQTPGNAITRGKYIQELWKYGVDNNQVDQCKLVEPTPTCQNIKAYDTNWGPITIAQLSTLKPGDKIRFTVSGTPANMIDKARFIINGITRPETTNKAPWPDVFYDEYTIPAETTSFTINAQLHHVTLGWF